MARIIRQDLDLMAEMDAKGCRLALDLRASTDGIWTSIVRAVMG
jgi:hypothetical protein